MLKGSLIRRKFHTNNQIMLLDKPEIKQQQ